MADTEQSRTEAPTQRRREEARAQGQVAVSGDLNSGLLILAGVGALWLGGRLLGGGLIEAVRLDLGGLRAGEFGAPEAHGRLAGMFDRGLGLIGVVLGVLFVTAAAVSVMQVGFHLSAGLLAPRWDRMSASRGWSRMFSAAAGMRGVTAVLKVAVMAAIAVWILQGRAAQIVVLGEGSLAQTVSESWSLVIRLGLGIGIALVVIGLADYGFQRWRHERSLLMTRVELKEELKREEGDPQMKARVRKIAREIAKRRMMAEVPTATVVITNPTHLAVALRYQRGTMAAPKVVAKGAGVIAERIIAAARRHAVPVVERKPIAQALYKAVKLGQEIPAVLYYAVAEILAFVYRLRSAA